jgi:flagellar hook-length control protein FliK
MPASTLAAADGGTTETVGFGQAMHTAQSGTASSADAASTTTPPRGMYLPGSPTEQIAAHLQHAVRSGNDRLTIRLTPEDLGIVEVTLRFDDDGQVRAAVAVERNDTLDLLQRDSRGLERALQDAGLKADSGSLSFSLRDDGRQNPQRGFGGFGSGESSRDQHAPKASPGPVVQAAANGTPRADGALDIRV